MTDEMPYSTETRIKELREFCERHDWTLTVNRANGQHEPEHLVAVNVDGLVLRSLSTDSLEVALARMELALQALGNACSDVYLHAPHNLMGRVR
jgi:hypothetical protein